jgi:O-antigen/teichoic acid export membrane protein
VTAADRAYRGLVRPIAKVFADPMLRNGHALIFSAGLTQGIGILYWVVAARNFPAAVVGRNSAAISITLFLAGIAELNMMSTLVRFLPTSGARSARFILGVYLASVAVALVVGLGFLLLIPVVEPQLMFLRSSPFLSVWFVMSIVTGAIFVLQDSALTGVRAATFIPLENAVFSFAKLAMMIPFVSLVPASGIYLSWTAAFALSVLPTNAYLFWRAIPRHLRGSQAARPPPKLAEVRSYLIPDSLAAFFFMAATSLLPLLIINRLGAAAAGHYALAWMMGYALYLVSLNMGSSLVVETAGDQSELRERCLRSITHLAKLLIPATAIIVVAAPYVLHFLGPGYPSATGVLRLLALSAIPALITNTAISVTRSQRNMRMVTGIQVVICLLVWALSATLMGPLGITGVGVAWLAAQTVTALALVAWPRLWLPARRSPAQQAPLPEQAAWPGVPRPSIEGPSEETTHEDTVHEDATAPDISQRRGGNPRSST